MRRVTRSSAILLLVSGFILTGCNSTPGEVRFVSRTNGTETLTLNRDRKVMTKLISAVHDVSIGSYTLKTTQGTTSGSFTSDGKGIKFKPDEGKAETVKFNSDGSFEFAQVTWAPRTDTDGKLLRVVTMPKELKELKAQ
jgi:hypothetical protein